MEVYGVSLDNIKQEHVKYIIDKYNDKEENKGRKRDAMACVKFFEDIDKDKGISIDKDIGNRWRMSTNCKCVGLLLQAIRYIASTIGIKMNYACRSAYMLDAFISCYYDQLSPLINNIHIIDVKDINNEECDKEEMESMEKSRIYNEDNNNKINNRHLTHVIYYDDNNGNRRSISFFSDKTRKYHIIDGNNDINKEE